MSKSGPECLYTPEIGQEICDRIAQGESVRAICRGNKTGFPAAETIRNWILYDTKGVPDSFREEYERARQVQADLYFEQVITKAEDCNADANSINKAKLEIDSLKWSLARMNRVKYGDRQAIDVGNQPDNPFTVQAAAKDALEDMSEKSRAALRKIVHEEMQGSVDKKPQKATKSVKS